MPFLLTILTLDVKYLTGQYVEWEWINLSYWRESKRLMEKGFFR
jgi:hypothetical protein